MEMEIYKYLLERKAFFESIKEKTKYQEGQLAEIKLIILKILDVFLSDSKVD